MNSSVNHLQNFYCHLEEQCKNRMFSSAKDPACQINIEDSDLDTFLN